MTEAFSPDAFVHDWLRDWNNHDLEAIVDHFTDDVVFASPLATQLFPASFGVVRGKSALRECWTQGLRRNPNLLFVLEGFYVGVGIIVINYLNESGARVCEVLEFDGDRVARGYATYQT
jgi:hypothetical protein